MTKITDDDVLKLALLSKLSLNDDQLKKFRDEIEEILNYIEQLQQVDTEGLDPTNQVTGLTNVMRDDEIADEVDKEELLKNAPGREGDYIKVRRVL